MRRRLSALLLLVLALAAPGVAGAAQTRFNGRVVDGESQQPIAGARIELTNSSGGSGYYRARSGSSGEFVIAEVTTDRYYNLVVSADGYADFVLNGWRLPEAQRLANVLVPLDRAGSLEVRVTRSDGRTAVPNASVTLRSESQNGGWEGWRPPPPPRFTDAQGVARFVDLTAGYWTLQVECDPYLNAEVRRVAVRRGEVTKAPVELSRPGSLSGTVTLADGTPVADVGVTARGPGEGVGTTAEDGSFTVGGLPAGRYRLEVTHDGFEPMRGREPWTLAEGQSRDAITMTVTPRPAEVAFVLPREVFAIGDGVDLGLRTYRVGVLDLELYRVPLPVVLDPRRDFRRLATGRDTTGLARVRVWNHSTAAGPPHAWREEILKLGSDLEPGAYLLDADAGAIHRRVLFFVSDLGVVVKRSKTRLLVAAASLRNGVAVAGALVSSRAVPPNERRDADDWSSVLPPGPPASATDGQGLAVLPLVAAPGRVRVIAYHDRHGMAIAEAPLAPAAEQGGDQAFLYTERPIYRPGQTVYWKLFARRAAASGYALPDVSDVRLALEGPDGASVEIPPARLSPRGSADGEIALPRDLPLGEYRLTAGAGRASGAATIAIEEYRKPEFQVEVTPERAVYVNGDEVRFQVAASYFFGAPVFGAAVRYNLFESRIGRDPDAWDGEGDWEPPTVGYGRVLETGEARLDAEGRASLAFVPARVAYDRRLTLEVEVVDASSRVVRGRGAAVMGRGLFTVSLRPVNRMTRATEPVAAEVRTRDHAGKPVSAAVTVTLDQDAWNPIERRSVRSTRPLATATVTTDATGRARVALTPSPARSGNLTLRARAEDAKGNRVTDEANVWVYDPKVWQYAYRYPSLEVFADRERYAPGDTARIVVNTEVGYAAVLATVEGRELEDHQVVHLLGNTGLVSFPVRPEYAPNVYVTVQIRRGKEVLSRTLELDVAGTRRDLAISLTPDRDEYRPGDEARVRIETRGADGRGTPAEVSLGVVDEAIYALRADGTPDPHEVFYGKRPNWVTTVVSFPSMILGGADKSGQEELRRDFRDVAFWGPSIATDAAGRAEAVFRFPDNLTTWRLTSRGATDDTRVGQATARALVTRDLIARLSLPRFLIAGDRAEVVSVTTNRSRAPLPEVNESIEAEGPVAVTGARSAVTSIPAAGESRRAWTIEVARDLTKLEADRAVAPLRYRARAGEVADALELPLPVLPRAVALSTHGAGTLDRQTETLAVPLPSDLIRVGSVVRLDLSPSPAALALSAVRALGAYPWGCTEQTANAMRPALALIAALKPAGVTPPGWEQPGKAIDAYVARLAALQSDAGGWGWWKEGEVDPYLTALACDALSRAVALELGGDAAKQSLMRAFYALPRVLSEVRSSDGEAYCIAHLANMARLSGGMFGEGPESQPAQLKQRLETIALSVHAAADRLGVAGLALATKAHADLGRAAEAKALLALLMKRSVSDGAGLHWPASREDAWFGDEEENTGYALSAMLAVDPGDARARPAIEWLARRRRGAFWKSTRVTAPVAIALAEYLARHHAEAKPNYTLAVEWNGERLLERAITPADAWGADSLRLEVGGDKLKPGANRLVITKRGAGSVSWSWEARALVPSPGPPPAKQPLEITRTYLRAERTTDRRGRPQYLATPLAAGEALKVGDRVMVRLVLRTAQPLRHLMIEDPRAAGFEVDALTPDGVERPWNLHAEERDERSVFFVEAIESGETVIEYLVRPELAGRLTALPASATGMYDPDLRVRSGEERFEVTGK